MNRRSLRFLSISTALLALAVIMWSDSSMPALADTHSLTFEPGEVTLNDNGDSATINVSVADIAPGSADTVQVNIIHDDAVVMVTSPECVGLYAGAHSTSAVRVDGDTATAFSCSLAGGPSSENGTVATFVLTRVGPGEPTLEFGTSGPFRTTFIQGGTAIPNGSLGSLKVLDNHAPVLETIPDQSVSEGESLDVGLSASDINGDLITLTAQIEGGGLLPDFAGLTDNGDGTGSIAFNPLLNDAGTYVIEVTASDGTLEHSQTFTLTVDPMAFDITGTVSLQGVVGATAFGAIKPTVSLVPGAGAGSGPVTVDVASDGTFVIAGVLPGTYTVLAEAAGFLSAERVDVEIVSTQVDLPPVELSGGDVDGDGSISGFDMSALIPSFGLASGDLNGRKDAGGNVVDINADGVVDAADMSIVAESNYGSSGPQPW